MRTAVLLLALSVFACRKEAPPAKQAATPGLHEIVVTEKGFEPDRVQAAPNEKVTLRFTRKADRTCADAVEVQGDPVKHVLPLNAPVDVKVTAPPSGELAFACPMNMYKGSIVVVTR